MASARTSNAETSLLDTLTLKNLQLVAAHELIQRVGGQLDLTTLAVELAGVLAEFAHTEMAVVLVTDDESGALKYGGISRGGTEGKREQCVVSLLGDDPLLVSWRRGQGAVLDPSEVEARSPLQRMAAWLGVHAFGIPLIVGQHLHGAAFVYNPGTGALPSMDTRRLLDAIIPTASVALKNARQHSRTVAELADKMHELTILRRIDRELTDTIELEMVFNITLDWALRFTNAHAASLALYDDENDILNGIVDYGYEISAEQMQMLRNSYGMGIAHRVARSGRAEIVPDVSLDHDYINFSSAVRSHVSLPVMREERVVAVMSVESWRLNGFRDDHVEFIEKLASRAGVAIDNARLYSETNREREKLSRILSGIADPVVVVGSDERVSLINQSARAVLKLPPEQVCVGQQFSELFADSGLLRSFQRTRGHSGASVEELRLDDGRTFYVNLALHEPIGWIIVMHDITPLKMTDQLKTELVQTVSHDLKQPLGVMNGYVELLLMQNKLDETGEKFAGMILRSIQSMRQLIDDLLDLAKIESGVQLEMVPTTLASVIDESIGNVRLMASNKDTQVMQAVPANLPPVMGDYARLVQIFNNLIGNAIKYSPRSSEVRVTAEADNTMLRVFVKDNGIGIAPEDQARIFDRFYRVRRTETKDIEGTGLGLAIVKKLIEAHGGQIGLESHLGEGSVFTVSLPLQANGMNGAH